jgi:hypothetical protein
MGSCTCLKREKRSWTSIPLPYKAGFTKQGSAPVDPILGLQRHLGNQGMQQLDGVSGSMVQSQIEPGNANGKPLPAAVKARLEGQFRQPLDGLKIYTGEEGEKATQKYSAQAVSKGSAIYFSPGSYAPGTDQGDRILRHEVAHYLQRQPGQQQSNGPSPVNVLEAEADLSALTNQGPIRITGIAPASQPLCMKTFVSNIGKKGYLEDAAEYYDLWENEDAIRVSSFQDILEELADEQVTTLGDFRIVAHGDSAGLDLFHFAGTDYVPSEEDLALQTRTDFAQALGEHTHIHDYSINSGVLKMVYNWIAETEESKELIEVLELGESFKGLWHEWVWWAVEEYYVEYADVAHGASSKKIRAEKDELLKKINSTQDAVKAAINAAYPSTKSEDEEDNVDRLKDAVHKACEKENWPYTEVPEGYLAGKTEPFETDWVEPYQEEIEEGAFTGELAAVKEKVDETTYIEIRGCNVGNNDNFLNGVRKFFGTDPDQLPSISAPKMYHFYGKPFFHYLEDEGDVTIQEKLEFLFNEAYQSDSKKDDVKDELKDTGFEETSDLADVLMHADISAQFDAWWKMKQKKDEVADVDLKDATAEDFKEFLTTDTPRTLPINVPGVDENDSIWYFLMRNSNAAKAVINWLTDQGYTEAEGQDLLEYFFKGEIVTGDSKKFKKGMKKLVLEWLGDEFPVPRKIIFPEDPEFEENIRRIP